MGAVCLLMDVGCVNVGVVNPLESHLLLKAVAEPVCLNMITELESSNTRSVDMIYVTDFILPYSRY